MYIRSIKRINRLHKDIALRALPPQWDLERERDFTSLCLSFLCSGTYRAFLSYVLSFSRERERDFTKISRLSVLPPQLGPSLTIAAIIYVISTLVLLLLSTYTLSGRRRQIDYPARATPNPLSRRSSSNEASQRLLIASDPPTRCTLISWHKA